MTKFQINTVLGTDGVTAADLAEAIEAGGVQRIVVNSDGGSIRTGAALADLIDQHGITLEIHKATSAAAIVATAGNARTIAADGFIAVHQAWRALAGGAAELLAAADQLRQADDLLAHLLARRSQLSVDETAHAIRTGRRWTADEALADGLVDRIGPAAGLAGSIPDHLIDGPGREAWALREAAERHRHRAELERRIETASTAQLDAAGGRFADAVEAFSPAARLASTFDHSAGDARRRALDPDREPSPPRWCCPACGFLNQAPPAAGFRPTACHHCSTTISNER